MPTTAPAYDPQKASVARRDRSSGGAHHRQMPWQAGYVTPLIKIFELISKNQMNRVEMKELNYEFYN
jgi:hypothetical protein